MKELMIDIETLDTSDSAIVFQVGVVLFDMYHEDKLNTSLILNKQTFNLCIDEQVEAGRTINHSTVQFHLEQPPVELKEPKCGVRILHERLAKLISDNKPDYIWSKGSFDFNVLENLFNQFDFYTPWKFWQPRELRTLMGECGVDKGYVAHNAINDCLKQIQQLYQCRKIIGLNTNV